jgi:hypothetical protein
VTPDPAQIATEGALWGSIHAHAFLRDTVIVSDDAGQFDVGHHALCWVHAERLIHKLDTFTEQQRVSQQHVRSLIWRFYPDLKAYRTNRHRAVAVICRPELRGVVLGGIGGCRGRALALGGRLGLGCFQHGRRPVRPGAR